MKFQFLSKLSFRDRRGYTLLFAVIVSVLVLSVAAFIVSVSRKQFILSSAYRDSTNAFYAADSGLECAIENFDNSPASLSTTTIYQASTGIGPAVKIFCGAANWTGNPVSSPSPSRSSATTTIQIPITNGGGACAIIQAYYSAANSDGDGATVYYIDAHGYNIGWDSTSNTCSLYGPRRVERALRYVLNE